MHVETNIKENKTNLVEMVRSIIIPSARKFEDALHHKDYQRTLKFRFNKGNLIGCHFRYHTSGHLVGSFYLRLAPAPDKSEAYYGAFPSTFEDVAHCDSSGYPIQ